MIFIKMLLEKGADANHRDSRGISALQLAAGKGYSGIAGMLLDEGANLKNRDKTGNTILHAAARGGLPSLIKVCLNEKLDVNAFNHDGWIPLHSAVDAGQVEAAELLINRGAIINAGIWREFKSFSRNYPPGTTPREMARLRNDVRMDSLFKKYGISD